MPGDETSTQARLIAGRYRLVHELGRGGMAVVWLADDELAGRRVAVKELRPPAGLSDADRQIHTRRALQEARSAASINHPGAVTLFDVLPATAADDAIYLIMELIHGPTLGQLVSQQGRLPEATVASIGRQLLDVLQAAHNLGIVHRDVKPGNIMIAAGNELKLTDFGIAHTVGDPRHTRDGVMGTEAYLAPELFDSRPITPAVDLWALGATLYFAATGHGPFERDSRQATVRAVLFDDIPVPGCSAGLAQAISEMLQRDPERRATIPAIRTQLLAIAAGSPEPASEPPDRRRPAGLAVQPSAADAAVFTNLPRRFSLALVRAGMLAIIFGGGAAGLALVLSSGVNFGLVLGVYLVLAFGSGIVAMRALSRRRTLILDSRGLTVRIATSQANQHTIAAVSWDQVVRIGCFQRPIKPHLFLSAWVSDGESKPARMVGLCPVGSPHFPMAEILAAIRSYCPTVPIDALPHDPPRAL